MALTTTIERAFTETAERLDAGWNCMSGNAPAPAGGLLRRIGDVQVEAVRQAGVLTVLGVERMTRLVDTVDDRRLAVVTDVEALIDDVETEVDAAVERVLDGAERVEEQVESAVGEALDAAERAGRRAADAVADTAGRAVEDVDDAVEAVAEAGTSPSGAYETWTKAELYERAQELDVPGRSGMTKSDLIAALRRA